MTTAAAPVEVDTELAALRATAADVAASRATFLVQIHSLIGTCPTRWGIGDDQAIGEARELAQDPSLVGSTGTRARQYLAGLDALDARASDIQARITHLEHGHATTGSRTRPDPHSTPESKRGA